MPKRCRDNPEMEKGLQAGVQAVYDVLNLPENGKPTKKSEIKTDTSKLTYRKVKAGVFTYEKVFGIPEETKKKIFYEIVKYEDKTGDAIGYIPIIAKRFKLPGRAVKAIKMEGMIGESGKYWPMP